ncbi:MAG TPA: Nramp family divalent metal transporter [Vicinamibacteria bacterium]|nr:Nramp family divalent metal transporter [Vicinamibacteria bacterium]
MKEALRTPPRGLAILLIVGPAFVWSAEYIGTGEVLLATRAGAVLGTAILWAVVLGILLKYWIGMAGARYTACTGEGMVDLFARVPGPRNWAVWIVLVVQLLAGALSIGAVATAAGAFLNRLVPPLPGSVAGWMVAGFAFVVAWTGAFDLLKGVMSFFVLLIVGGALYAAAHVFPGALPLLQSLTFQLPPVPAWAAAQGVQANPWREIMPLLGWGAGGFASQVWYTYWVLGAGYGAAEGRGYGQPADRDALSRMTRATAEKVGGWCRVVYVDATIALVIGVVVTSAFVISGAGVLRPLGLLPKGAGAEMAGSIAAVFSSQWGALGGTLFLVAAIAALVGTLLGQLAGWPRLLADAFRLAIPAVHRRFAWKAQFRFFLVFFFCTNMVIVYVMQKNPIGIVQTAAVLDGILLTALQALWVGLGLYVVLPRLLSKEAWDVLRPSPVFALGLAAGAIVFGWLTVTEAVPQVLSAFGVAR